MDTATRLESLEARSALLDVCYSYAHAFDQRDPELFRAVFHDDALLDLGDLWGSYRGIDAILSAAGQFWAGASSMHHWMANPLFDIDLESGTGTGSISLDCVSTFHDTGTAHVGARYADRFRREGGVWKISERVMELQFVTPMPQWIAAHGTEAADR